MQKELHRDAQIALSGECKEPLPANCLPQRKVRRSATLIGRLAATVPSSSASIHAEGNLTLYGLAVTTKDAAGKLSVKEAPDDLPGTAAPADDSSGTDPRTKELRKAGRTRFDLSVGIFGLTGAAYLSYHHEASTHESLNRVDLIRDRRPLAGALMDSPTRQVAHWGHYRSP